MAHLQDNLPAIQAVFEQLLNDLADVVEGILIQDSVHMPGIYEQHPDCIIGSVNRIYGSQASFEEVAAAFRTRLEGLGWSYSSHEDPQNYHYFRNPDETTMIVIDTLTVDQQPEDYRSIYHFFLFMAYPSLATCLDERDTG